jgi:WD40 repeat protein
MTRALCGEQIMDNNCLSCRVFTHYSIPQETSSDKIFNCFFFSSLQKGHSDSVTSVRFSTDGQYVASAGMDGKVKVWKVENGEEAISLEGPDGEIVSRWMSHHHIQKRRKIIFFNDEYY